MNPSSSRSLNLSDVLVVGGGILGTSVAYHLARYHGMRVTLLERQYLAVGSSGRCICGVRQQFSNEPTIRIAMESVSLFKQMSVELEVDVEWASTGYLFLAHDQEHLERYRTLQTLQVGLGLPVSILDGAGVINIVPGISSEGLLGAAWCPEDGQANPFRVVYGYARMLKKLGGRVVTGAEVAAVDVVDGRVGRVTTTDGTAYVADHVILAAGPLINRVASLAGVEVPVVAERHEALVTEPTGAGGLPMLVDYRDGGCYFTRLAGAGQIIGCVTPVPPVPGNSRASTMDFLCRASGRMVRLMPELARVKVLRQWAGSYEMTPDGNPVVGETPVKGLWVIGGMCGHGFMLGPAMGRLLATKVAGGEPAISLEPFRLDREYVAEEALR